MIIIIGNSLSGGGTGNSTQLYYFPILGQSQAGGYLASPALTTVSAGNVQTLTSGPIDASTVGSLIASVEGDDFTDTNGGGASPAVETIATSFAQQLKTFRNSRPNDLYVVTVHARGGETIQALGKGGTTGRYEEIITTVNRLQTICIANNYRLVVHPVFFHGGNGDNTGTSYKDKLVDLYNDFNTDINTVTNQGTVYLFTHQQRIIGTPDYGQQQYEASLQEPKIVVVGPEYPLLLSLGGNVQYQGDAVHITNHGTRYLGVIWAQAVYRKLFSSGFKPLELDIANSTFNGSNQITIPILNKDGTLSISTNAGIEIYSNTTSAVLASTTALSGDNLVVTITTPPIGSHNLVVRSGLTARGWTKSTSALTSQFNNSVAAPYPLDKYMVRAEYAKTVVFPVNMLLNFGGLVADPAVAGTYSIWDNLRVYTDVDYPISGNVNIQAKNTASRYWGFISLGAAKSGNNPVTGTNFYPNDVVANWWFTEGRSADVNIRGLNPSKTYKIIVSGIRPNVGTLRESFYTINGTTIVKTSNRAGTDTIFTTEAECAVFNPVSPSGSGELLITVGNQTDVFGYLTSIQVIEL